MIFQPACYVYFLTGGIQNAFDDDRRKTRVANGSEQQRRIDWRFAERAGSPAGGMTVATRRGGGAPEY